MAGFGMSFRILNASGMPDLSKYTGREQGFVKHALIEKYLERFAFKIGSKWDDIAYIDAFAGPWASQAEDLSDTSFGIALKRIKSGVRHVRDIHNRSVRVRAFLIEKDPSAFTKLNRFAETQEERDFQVTCLCGEFHDKAKEIATALNSDRTFVFALIDPKGWSGLSMEVISPLVRRRSAEVLVNVMTSFIRRFADVDQCKESYNAYFGRPGVREIIARTPQSEREDIVVREYCRSLRALCGFKHVSSCVVLQEDKRGIKYFMVFGTNNAMGIKVFKEAESHAASLQDEIKFAKEFGNNYPLFSSDQIAPVSETLRQKYRDAAFARVEELFRDRTQVPYTEIFCKALAMPLVTEVELLDFIHAHSNLELQLDGSRRKKPSIDIKKGDRVIWIDSSSTES